MTDAGTSSLASRLRPGQTLLEIAIAMAVFGVILTALAPLSLIGFSRQRAAREYTQAAAIARQGLEATRSMARQSFDFLVNGNHGLTVTGSVYRFSGTSDTVGIYQRTITVITAQRNGLGALDDSPGGTDDPAVKKVTSTVTWLQTGTARTGTVSFSTYLATW